MSEEAYGIKNTVHPLKNPLPKEGYMVLENILSKEETTIGRKKITNILKQQEKEFGIDNLEKIQELNTVRSPLAYDIFFLEMCSNKKLLKILSQILGEYYILHLQNGIINTPENIHNQSKWHRDLPYQNFVISTPLAVSALFCLDDFTEQNGATFVLPKSHLNEHLSEKKIVEKNKTQITAKEGSIILFDSMLFHKAGINKSNNNRIGINHVYTSPIIKQQIDLPDLLGSNYPTNNFLRRFLGYDSKPPTSIKAYREKRLKRL